MSVKWLAFSLLLLGSACSVDGEDQQTSWWSNEPQVFQWKCFRTTETAICPAPDEVTCDLIQNCRWGYRDNEAGRVVVNGQTLCTGVVKDSECGCLKTDTFTCLAFGHSRFDSYPTHFRPHETKGSSGSIPGGVTSLTLRRIIYWYSLLYE